MTMTRHEKISYMMARRYQYHSMDTLIKYRVKKTALVQSAPSWIQDIADSIIFNSENDTVVILDSYGRQLHTPRAISW